MFASLWQGSGLRLWTVVNRATEPFTGEVLSVPHVAGMRYFDLISGREIAVADNAASAMLAAALPPRGMAAFLAARTADLGADFPQFLQSQAELQRRADWSTTFPALETRLSPAP